MSDSLLPNNIDKSAFIAGYVSVAKEKKAFMGLPSFGHNIGQRIGNGINSAVEGYIGRRTGAALKPTLDAAQQAGIKFQTGANGLPTKFDVNGSINGVAGNYASNMGNQLKNWFTNQYSQATTDPMSWAKNNPWTAGGTALLGGGLLYGAGKMLFGGSPKPQPQMQSPYQVPYNPYMIPGALQKSSGVLPMFRDSIGLPSMLAQNLAGTGQAPEQPQMSAPQPININSSDPRVHKLLQNPKMQDYIRQLIQQA